MVRKKAEAKKLTKKVKKVTVKRVEKVKEVKKDVPRMSFKALM